jgi:hypothetical protein
MRRLLATLLTAFACVVLAACGGSDSSTVKWPALSKLDEATHRLGAAADSAPKDEFVAAMKEWSDAAFAAASDKAPANVANKERVALLQRDLNSLAKSATTADAMPDEFGRKMAKGLQHAVHDLMDAAGMPHVHAHPAAADSDDDDEAKKKSAN